MDNVIVTIDIAGGVVVKVDKPENVTLRVRDYDIEGADAGELVRDGAGREYRPIRMPTPVSA